MQLTSKHLTWGNQVSSTAIQRIFSPGYVEAFSILKRIYL